MIKKETEVAIVGGGVIGLLTACMLAEQGREVIIFDQSDLARESSWAGGGILTPLYPWRYPDPVNELAFRSQLIYPGLIQTLYKHTDIDPQYIEGGMLIKKSDVDEVGYQWLDKHHIDYKEGGEFLGIHLSLKNTDFLYLPKIAQVRNPRFAQALEKRALQLGVKINSRCQVNKLAYENSLFHLDTYNGKLVAEQLVISAGAWSANLLKDLGVSLPVKPVRGQMLLYKAEPNFLSSIILSEGHYLIPRQDGRVLVGSTMEDVGFDKEITTEAKEMLEAFVAKTLPELQKYPIEKHWAGLRPSSPEGIPFIMRHPKLDNLFINTGHFRNGVVMAPASAELLVDLMLGNKPKINDLPFRLEVT